MKQPRRAMDGPAILAELGKLSGWKLCGKDLDIAIEKLFRFQDFHETMAFVNAVALIAHRQDHHPVMTVAFNRCTVHWNTHDANGLTDTDFDCAALVDRLLP